MENEQPLNTPQPVENKPPQSSLNPKIFSIIGLVLGIFTLIFSLIPCIGYYALVPAIIAAICSGVAWYLLKKENKSVGLAATGVMLGAFAIASATYQYIQFKTIFDTKKKIENIVEEVPETIKEEAKEAVIDFTKEKIEDYLDDDKDSTKTKNGKKPVSK
jgi:hypothetical protein